MFEVVDQYDSFFRLGLTDQEKNDLIQHLLGPIDPCSNVAHEKPGTARGISCTPPTSGSQTGGGARRQAEEAIEDPRICLLIKQLDLRYNGV